MPPYRLKYSLTTSLDALVSSVDLLQHYDLQAIGNNDSAVVQEEILVKSELISHLPIRR